MFTGIVEEAGRVEAVKESAAGIRLVVRAKCGAELAVGASLAVNGCCLTAVEVSPKAGGANISFDLLQETWKRTNLQFVKKGSLVNLERPLRADGRLDGHFVTGHIDGVGKILRSDRSDADHVLEISAPAALMRYAVYKGSIAVDGISLTLGDVEEDRFTVWIIPHTWEVTALRERKVRDSVNLEMDLLGKYVEKFLRGRNHGHETEEPKRTGTISPHRD